MAKTKISPHSSPIEVATWMRDQVRMAATQVERFQSIPSAMGGKWKEGMIRYWKRIHRTNLRAYNAYLRANNLHETWEGNICG